MRHSMRGILAAMAVFGMLLVCHGRTAAADPSFASNDQSVQVHFAKGKTEIANLSQGVTLFSNRDYQVQQFPDEISGLDFTRRPWRTAANVTIDAPAQSTVYVLLSEGRATERIRDWVASNEWEKIGELHFDEGNMWVYKRTFDEAQSVMVKGAGEWGTIILARRMTIAGGSPPDKNPPASPDDNSKQFTSHGSAYESIGESGPTTRLSKFQASIISLYVMPQDTGEMLGGAEDFILTATPGEPSGDSIPVTFTSPVDSDMHEVLADVCRALNVKYAHGEASKYELSFTHEFPAHSGPSIGAACGTLFLSLIEGFDIDPKFAITGDVTADGKIRPIGGVAAKTRGAILAGCDVMGVPCDNYDQVVDAFIYEGPELLTKIQVIGVSNLDDAASLARMDRSEDLRRAIDLFADVQSVLENSPSRIHDKDIQDKLSRVVELEPNHFSAKLLLLLSENKSPKRLSAETTLYYTDVAAATMFPTLLQRSEQSITFNTATPAIVQIGLKKLQKVRWYADLECLPYVDSVQDFMQTMLEFDSGEASKVDLQTKAQAVEDQWDKLHTDRDLWEKMMREGA